MSEMMTGWNNGKYPLAGLLGGDRNRYRHEAEMENLRHANAKDLEAHRSQLAHENRIAEMKTAHRHATAQADRDHRNAMDFETHRATTAADLFERAGGGAPMKTFTVGDMSASYGPRPRTAKKATPAKKTPATKAASTTAAKAGTTDDDSGASPAVKPAKSTTASKTRSAKNKS